MASTSQLGYTNSQTAFIDPISTSFVSRTSWTLPSKGVWLVICGYEFGTNTDNTVENKKLIISTTTGGTTPAAYGLYYFDEINDAAGGALLRQVGTIMGVVSVATSTILYANASSTVNIGTNMQLRLNVSWTRIG